MAPWNASRPLSRLSTSSSANPNKVAKSLASSNIRLRRRPVGQLTPGHSRQGNDRWLAQAPRLARVTSASSSQGDEEQTFGRFNDNLDQVMLAIEKSKTSIGASYYIAQEGVLRVMEPIDCSAQDFVKQLTEDIRPTIVLLSSFSQSFFEKDLYQHDSFGRDGDEMTLPYKIEMRPFADFKYESALHKLSGLPYLQRNTGVRFMVPGEEEGFTEDITLGDTGMTEERGRALHVSGSINLEGKTSVGCAGAIITYLQRKKASEYLHGDPTADEAYPILRLETFGLKSIMSINLDTLAALQIIQPESHPSAAKQGPDSSGSKESLSVYGLFYHFARTPQGKQQLRHLFLHPSLDIGVIKERHQAVGVFSRAQNQTLLPKLSQSLSKIKNMRRTLLMMHKGVEGGNTSFGGINSIVWSSLLDFCFHVIDISETLAEVIGIETLPLLCQIDEVLRKFEFQRLGKIMFDVVDLDESQYQRRTVIKRGINEDLDRVKDAYDGMDEMLQQAAIESLPELDLAHDMPRPKLNVIYLPQLGFLVLLSVDDWKSLTEREINPQWEQIFTTESGVYFKTHKTREMDSDLGDIWAIICDIEIEISYDLAQKVLEREDFLIVASDFCGELDAILALSRGAQEYKLVKPHIVEDNVIDIRAGRHLLQELATPHYVPNDAFLAGEESDTANLNGDAPSQRSNMLLLTGPNFSGKSVYLKQVALIVYMAQVGSFVPAKSARLGITDKILTRITTRETVSKCQSSFMIDLQQIAWALRDFTARSLLVIDEFGKGTDSCDGAGLVAGVITYLLSGAQGVPKVLASTHFHEIFEQGLIDENMRGINLRQMEVKLSEPDKSDREMDRIEGEAIYLYQVKPGRSALSYGAQCAAMNGIPEEIVQRACELTKLAAAGDDLVSACSHIPQEEMRALEEAEMLSRDFLRMDLNAVVDIAHVEDFRTSFSRMIDQSLLTPTIDDFANGNRSTTS